MSRVHTTRLRFWILTQLLGGACVTVVVCLTPGVEVADGVLGVQLTSWLGCLVEILDDWVTTCLWPGILEILLDGVGQGLRLCVLWLITIFVSFINRKFTS